MPPTIGLAMIVRNESQVIDRCLDSVKPLIDTWTIVDTGSTDDTVDRVRRSLDALPGALHRRDWVNFGHNRTELMTLAAGTADYLLLIDADMTVVRQGDLGPLGADAYLLRHVGNLDYAIPRLVRGDLPWHYVGATHEYLASDAPHAREPFDALAIAHHADGGSRSDKFQRDRRLLEAALEEDPTDARTLFYLAQTYRDLGETTRAIETYRRRVEVGGWEEETFYAQLQIGRLLEPSDWDQAATELLHAWELRPTRSEPLLDLARGYRARDRHHLAELYSRRGLEIGVPDDLLFVHRDGYDWALRFEHAIALYWTGDLAGARAANHRLLADGVPEEILPWVRHNLAWCNQALAAPMDEPDPVTSLPLLADLVGDLVGDARRSDAESTRSTGVDLVPIELATPAGWSSLNPSIAGGPDGAHVLVRTVNYILDDAGRYIVTEANELNEGFAPGTIRTRNVMATLGPDLTLTATRNLTEIPPGPPAFATRVRGYEDCRLIRVGQRWLATGTVRDRNDEEWCETALLDLDAEDPAPLRVLEVGRGPRHEKNWMPFVVNGQLHLVIQCGPTVVARCDVDTGELTVVADHPGPPGAGSYRGGSQGLPDGDGWIFVVHQAHRSSADNDGRRYSHRFIRMGPDFAITSASEPFSFTGERIEFCAGIADAGDGAVLISFGVSDRSAMLARLSRSDIVALLP